MKTAARTAPERTPRRFDEGGIALECADCFDTLPDLADNSIDFVATDPPYFIDGFDGGWNPQKLAKRMKHNGTVRSMPGGMKFSPQQGADFQRFCERVSVEVLRVLKPGGFFVAFSQGRLFHRLVVAAEDTGFEVRDMLAWQRNGQAKAFSQEHFIRKMRISEAKKTEMIRQLGGRKTPQLRPMMEPLMLAQKPREGTFVENWLHWRTGLIDPNASLDGGFPGTLMCVAKPASGRDDCGGHLTVKPVALMAHLIRLFTTEGQVVLDPFLGSGATAIAAAQTGRQCIGFEIQPEYFRAAVERVREEQGVARLFV